MNSTHRNDRSEAAGALVRVALVVGLALVAALVLSACGGGGGEGTDASATAEASETAAGAADTADDATTEPEPEPEPITQAEKRWLRLLTRYNDRFERVYFRSGQVTHASMRREAALFRDCRATLRRAGDPGRMAPAAKPARRACERLDKAAQLLDEAIAASDPGGAVVVGTPEERIFNRARNAASEAAGNAHGGLQRAEEVARDVEEDLSS